MAQSWTAVVTAAVSLVVSLSNHERRLVLRQAQDERYDGRTMSGA